MLSQLVGVPGVSIVVQHLSTMLMLIFLICTSDHTRIDAFCCSAGISTTRKSLHKLSSCSHSLGPRSNTRAVILQHILREKSLGQVTHLCLMGDRVDRLLEGWVEATMGCRGEDAVVAVVERCSAEVGVAE